MKKTFWTCTLTAAATLMLITLPSFSAAQLPGTNLPNLGNTANQVGNTTQNLNQNIGNRIQDGVNIKPPSLKNTVRPKLNLNAQGGIQNTLNNQLQLRLGNLGNNLNSQLNLDQQGDLGLRLASNGVVIESVQDGSIAQQVGLNSGDQILAINNSWVRSSNDISSGLSASLKENGFAWIYVDRKGEEQWIQFNPESLNKPSIGVRIDDADGAVKITRVTEDSPAALAGLKAGDVVVSANGKEIKSNGELISMIRNSDGKTKMALVVERGGQTMQIQTGVFVKGSPATKTVSQIQQDASSIREDFAKMVEDQSNGEQLDGEAIKQKMESVESDLTKIRESTSEDVAQLREDTAGKVDELKTSIQEMAQNQSENQRERLNNLATRLDEMATSLRSSANERVSNATAMTQQQLDRMQQSISDSAQSVKDRAEQLRDGDTIENQRERLTQVMEKAQSISEQMKENAGDTKESSFARLTEIRDQAGDLQDTLTEMRAEVGATAQSQVDAMIEDVAAVRVGASAMAEAQFESAEAWNEFLNEQVMNEIKTVKTEIRELRSQVGDQNEALMERTEERVASVEKMIEDAQSDSGQKLEEARAEIADVEERLETIKENRSEQVGNNIERVQTRLNRMQNHLADMVQSRREQAGDAVETRSETAREKLTGIRDDLDNLSESANEDGKETWTSLSDRVKQRMDNLATGEDSFTSERLSVLKSEVQTWKKQVQESVADTRSDANEERDSIMKQLTEFEKWVQDEMDRQARVKLETRVSTRPNGG